MILELMISHEEAAGLQATKLLRLNKSSNTPRPGPEVKLSFALDELKSIERQPDGELVYYFTGSSGEIPFKEFKHSLQEIKVGPDQDDGL